MRRASEPGERAMRRSCASVLVMEAIVIVLAIPVAITISDADPERAGVALGGLALAGVLLAGLLRFRWAYVAGSVLQILVTGTGFVVPTMFFLGLVFGALWVTAMWLGRRVEGTPTR